MLTAKERPFCAYCNSLVGFTWFVRKHRKAPIQNPQLKPSVTESSQKGGTGAAALDQNEEMVEEGEKLKVVG